MKKLFSILAVAIFALSFVSCEKEDPRDEILGNYTLDVTISVTQTVNGTSESGTQSDTYDARISKWDDEPDGIRIYFSNTYLYGTYDGNKIALRPLTSTYNYTEGSVKRTQTTTITFQSGRYSSGRINFLGSVIGTDIGGSITSTINGNASFRLYKN